MASRSQRCNLCGVKVMVPLDARTMRCPWCQTITAVRPLDPFDRAQDQLLQGARRVKGMISNLSNTIETIATSVNNYPGTTAQPSYSSYGHHAPTLTGPPLHNSYGYPPPISRPLSYPSVQGKKRALLCGLRYKSRRYELKGSINDVNCMRYFLVEKMAFPKESILILTEEERDPYRVPTKQNIQKAMQWLVQGCKSGDSLVFHYSGHGSQQRNSTGDEIDGFDETLCPLDYETEGMIVDDEINATIVRPLPKGVILHAIIDACHSGTVLDLPYLCRMNQNGNYVWENHCPPSGAYKGTNGGLALSFSACDDNQTSADTTVFSGNTMTGAMTFSFIQAAQSAPGLTYGHLLNAMRFAIRDANANRGMHYNGPISSLLKKVFFTGLSQEPQLSSSKTFDIYMTQFVL